MTKLYREFRASLKDTEVEEAVDLFFFRPISFLFVKVLYLTPITPNQISLLAIVSGIVSGIFFAGGTQRHFLYGGLFYALSHILDCCDGMIARLKKNGTPIGRIIDGWADYVTSTAVYIGFVLGLLKSGIDLPTSPWIMVAVAGFCNILHSITVDYHRWEFMAHGLGKVSPMAQDVEVYSALLAQMMKKKGRYLEKLLISVYLGYTKLQLKDNGGKEKKSERHYEQQAYYHSNRPLLFMWNFIGLSTHIFFMVLGAVLFQPMIFFYYVLAAANVLMLVLGIIQAQVNKKIPIKAEA